MLAGTPIGDLDDASPSLRRAIAEADVVAAEDTRRFATLLKRLGLRSDARVVSYFDGNESERTPGLLAELQAGRRVVLLTDAGMPMVSDPGYRLARAAIDAGVAVTAVPGPSAVTTALALSGLPVDRFCFEGFLPRAAGPRRRRLAELATEPRTMVFFEAPHRLEEFLADCAASFGGERRAAVCRELTKTYEEVRRDSLAALREWAAAGVRGEITVVVGGFEPDPDADALALVRARMAEGEKLSAAVAEVASITGANRKQLYADALADRRS